MKKFLIAICMVALMAAPALAGGIVGSGSLSGGGSTIGTLLNGGIQGSGAIAGAAGIGRNLTAVAKTNHFGYTMTTEMVESRNWKTLLPGHELQRSTQSYTESSATAKTPDARCAMNVVAGAGLTVATSSILTTALAPGKAVSVSGGAYFFAGLSGSKISGSGSSLSNAATFKGFNATQTWTGSQSNNVTKASITSSHHVVD